MDREWEHILSDDGAARAILKAGGPFSQHLRSGQWRPPTFQPYLDLGREEPRAVASVSVEASDDDH